MRYTAFALLLGLIITNSLFADCGSSYCSGIAVKGYVRDRFGAPINKAYVGNAQTNASGYYTTYTDTFVNGCTPYDGEMPYAWNDPYVCSTFDPYSVCASKTGYYGGCGRASLNGSLDFVFEETTNPTLPAGSCKIEDSRFVSDGGGCKDIARNTIWTNISGTRDWPGAKAACLNLNQNGFDDWVLPTDTQFAQLTRPSGWISNFNFSPGSNFWTATEYEYSPVYFAYRMVMQTRKKTLVVKTTTNAVACVRVPTGPVPTVSLSAFPLQVVMSSPTNLQWTSTNATSCSLKQGTTVLATSASGSINSSNLNAGTHSFTLSCTGNGGTTSTSISVTATPRICGILYPQANYRGAYWLTAAANYAALNAAWDNTLTSFRVYPRCRLQVFENANYTGASQTFTGIVSSVPASLKDKISSMKCVCD